jgi:hypothetical protein
VASLGCLLGCQSIDLRSVRTASDEPPRTDAARIVGRIAVRADGQSVDFGVLGRPSLLLLDRGQRRLLQTPEADSQGRYRWDLPPGDYEVALIRGAMLPTQTPFLYPDGKLGIVNGLADPGVSFSVEAGRVYDAGTIVIEVVTRQAPGVIYPQRVFGTLRSVDVVRSAGSRPGTQPLEYASPAFERRYDEG